MNRIVGAVFKKVFDSSNPRSLAHRFRQRRLRIIHDAFLPQPQDRVLDIGSHGSFFREAWPYPAQVIGLDVVFREEWVGSTQAAVIGDVRTLPFKDRSLHIICNSVLEHVGPLADQRRAAHEIVRVGKRYFVQIPNKFFPIDPHYFTIPFFSWLPRRWQRTICRFVAVGYVARGDFLPLYYLTAKQLVALFPGARVVRERFLGLTKSLYVIGGDSPSITAPGR